MKLTLLTIFLGLSIGISCQRNEAEYYGYAKKPQAAETKKTQLSPSEQISKAIQNDDWPLIQEQIAKGLSVNFILESGRTLLNESIQWNRETIFRNLISLGADVSIKDQNGLNTLEMCIERINFLVLLNPSLLPQYQEELFRHLENEDNDEVKRLLEQNLNPNFLLPSGETPLTYTVANNLENGLRALTDPRFKIDIHQRDQSGKTALALAKVLKLNRIEKILLSRGAQY